MLAGPSNYVATFSFSIFFFDWFVPALKNSLSLSIGARQFVSPFFGNRCTALKLRLKGKELGRSLLAIWDVRTFSAVSADGRTFLFGYFDV